MSLAKALQAEREETQRKIDKLTKENEDLFVKFWETYLAAESMYQQLKEFKSKKDIDTSIKEFISKATNFKEQPNEPTQSSVSEPEQKDSI